MKRHLWPNCASSKLKFFLLFLLSCFSAEATELPAVRITQAILNEKSLALWIGVEQGFFRKHGASVEIIQTRTSTQTIAALASGEIQIAGTTPSVVLNAALAGMVSPSFAASSIGPMATLWWLPESVGPKT